MELSGCGRRRRRRRRRARAHRVFIAYVPPLRVMCNGTNRRADEPKQEWFLRPGPEAGSHLRLCLWGWVLRTSLLGV
jgi:hypothetical protein